MDQGQADREVLETERLRLRALLERDVPRLVELAGDREVAANTLTVPHPYMESDAREFLARSRKAYDEGREFVFAISERDSDLLVGACGIAVHETHRSGEIGYWIGRPYWNRGYASEAVGALIDWTFSHLGLEKIVARVFCGNDSSSRVLKKLGMECEAVLRQHLVKWGQRRDVEVWVRGKG